MPAAKNFEMQESTHLPDSDDESGGADKDEEACTLEIPKQQEFSRLMLLMMSTR